MGRLGKEDNSDKIVANIALIFAVIALIVGGITIGIYIKNRNANPVDPKVEIVVDLSNVEAHTSTIKIGDNEETINVKTYQSPFGYSIDFDIDRFEISRFSNKDKITSINNPTQLYIYIEKTSLDYYLEHKDSELFKIDPDKGLYYKISITNPFGATFDARLNAMLETFKIS